MILRLLVAREECLAVLPQIHADRRGGAGLDANAPWELGHYRSRIPDYYGDHLERAVLGILDGIVARTVGVEPVAVSINDLLVEGRAAGTLDDRERLIDRLRLMEQDHYLSRDPNGDYRFRFPLLQRWWRLARGL